MSGRFPLAVALLLGAILGELVWGLQVDGAAGDPPEGWRDEPDGPLQSAAFDWGAVGAVGMDFAPVGGVDWRSSARSVGRGPAIEAELHLAEGATTTLWLGAPRVPGSLGLRVSRAADGWRAALSDAQHDAQKDPQRDARGCALSIPSSAGRARVGLAWAEGAATVQLGEVGGPLAPQTCAASAPPEGVTVQTSAARAGLRQLQVGGQRVDPQPRPYRLGAWLVGAGGAACFVLAQLAVGTPPVIALVSLLPMLLGLGLLGVPPGPLRAQGWSVGLLYSAPLTATLAFTLLIHAGRASRDLGAGRDWPWGAPLAAAMPLALTFAFTGPPRVLLFDALLGIFGASGLVVALVGALAVAGHQRPRRAAGLALIPTVLFSIFIGFVFRETSAPALVAGAVGLSFGLAAGALARGGRGRWRVALPLAVLGLAAVEWGLRSPAPPSGPPSAGPGGAAAPWVPEAPLALVVGDRGPRPGVGPGSLPAALTDLWALRWLGPAVSAEEASAALLDAELLVVIVGEPDLHHRGLGGSDGALGLAMGLWRATLGARRGALAPVVWPPVGAWLERAADVDLPVLLIVDPRQTDPAAMRSVVTAAGLEAAEVGRGPARLPGRGRAVMVHPVAQLQQGGAPLPGGGAGWRHTPEGGLQFQAIVQQGLAALDLDLSAAPPPPAPELPPLSAPSP
jgi:hypothetical protein